jgi:ammonia channel protein AmtB
MARTRIDIIWLVIGALVLGLLAFAISYWIFDDDYSDSITLASTVAISGFVGELLRGVNFKKKVKTDNPQMNK